MGAKEADPGEWPGGAFGHKAGSKSLWAELGCQEVLAAG